MKTHSAFSPTASISYNSRKLNFLLFYIGNKKMAISKVFRRKTNIVSD